jgi:hypothetical protein
VSAQLVELSSDAADDVVEREAGQVTGVRAMPRQHGCDRFEANRLGRFAHEAYFLRDTAVAVKRQNCRTSPLNLNAVSAPCAGKLVEVWIVAESSEVQLNELKPWDSGIGAKGSFETAPGEDAAMQSHAQLR